MSTPSSPSESGSAKRGPLSLAGTLRRWFFGLCIAAFGGSQFIPVERTNPAVPADFDGPPEVKQIFRRSCYDCHSNETVWPWYAHVAPVSWFTIDHVKGGRIELNFSRWGNLSAQKKADAKEGILDEVEEGKMPHWTYLLIHHDAKLSKADLETIRAWAGQEE